MSGRTRGRGAGGRVAAPPTVSTPRAAAAAAANSAPPFEQPAKKPLWTWWRDASAREGQAYCSQRHRQVR